jgi:AAA domain
VNDSAPFTTEPYVPGPESEHERSQRPTAKRERVIFKDLAIFCAEYVPLNYTIEGIVRSSSLYTMTARTGAGKTAFNVIAALAIATGRADILGRETVQGRVAYLAFENPDDVRMRFKIAAFLLNIDIEEIKKSVIILDKRLKAEDVIAELSSLANAAPFAAVFIDTFAAFFDGKDVNDNVQAGEFTRRLRPFTQIRGLPSVIVSSHPVKNAPADNLIPYGGGAILNESDGNLTLWKTDGGQVNLHWQGKLRGLEFQPLPFRFEICGSPDILDAKGREVHLPTMRPSSEEAAEQKRQSDQDVKRNLLRAMIADPNGTQDNWAAAIDRAKSSVNSRLQTLKRDKLVDELLGKWNVTAKGRKAAEQGPEQENG